MFALILKNLSDRQISIDKKIIDFLLLKELMKKYSNIFNFIYKIDELSLDEKTNRFFRLIKEVLGD